MNEYVSPAAHFVTGDIIILHKKHIMISNKKSDRKNNLVSTSKYFGKIEGDPSSSKDNVPPPLDKDLRAGSHYTI